MFGNKRFWIGIAISAVALYLTLRNVDFGAFTGALQDAQSRWWLFALAFVVFVIGLGFRAWRWSVLMGGTPLKLTFQAMCIGYMLNMMFPFRLGEIGRAWVMGQQARLGTAAALSSIVVERLLDLVVVVVAFLFFARLAPVDTSIAQAATAGGAFAVAVAVGIGVSARHASAVEQALSAILRKLPRLNASAWLRRYREFVAGLQFVRTPRQALLVLFTTLATWSFSLLLAVVMMAAFFEPRVEQAGLMVMASNLGGAAPSAPGGLGPVQLFAKTALVLPFGLDESRATAFAFVWSLSQQLTLIAFGLISMFRVGLSFEQLRARTEAAREHSEQLEAL